MTGKGSDMKTEDMIEIPDTAPITTAELAEIGGGRLAYVKEMRSDDINRLFPQAPDLESGLDLFALLGADGSPILLADTREAAVANAWEQELETVSLH
jgi:hypothetical protein